MKRAILIPIVTIAVMVLIILFNLSKPKTLDTQLKRYSDSAIKENKAKTISVYIEPINSGQSFGINEDGDYIPASLSKVPYLIAYLYIAQRDPASLDTKLEFTQAIAGLHLGDNQYPLIKDPLIVGEFYPIWDLLNRMVKTSDNNALQILATNVPKGTYADVYQSLGTTPQLNNEEKVTSPKIYSRYFTTLYNATYLNEMMSEKALSLLSEVEYDKALVAGIPPGIRVAHKYGNVNRFIGSTLVVGLNDCGIVYAAKPYTICVMTTGRNYQDLEGVIKDISAITYKELSK